ncbi:MAG: hypothetical protein GAK28_02935 [Luteibacter sp.]|uniref:hypothetical protein n=1 Tax=Luteibacter sp. TaxID=1886636 RepID=UPI00137D1B42|nr:hypothetical protein [Luteibacter sp.]KAF1006027.1 MAG: hypothetical protein GAK28_02935 [Luteibacter sp.]
MTTAPDSITLTDVIALLRKREQDGRSTHGTTVDRTDYSLLRWLTESQEEKADDLLYMGAAIRVATALIDERDRLRDALAEIVRIHDNVWSPKQADRIADIARKALEGASA